ncbi:hypothetical protein [Corynebacterium sp.]|uniref:hypothetical protein n=1 Tax=Corynebacterium sp. TaxID=1720 RepID=UPI0025BAD342|nr:hypothetical protein [Corynebacterium sp.]
MYPKNFSKTGGVRMPIMEVLFAVVPRTHRVGVDLLVGLVAVAASGLGDEGLLAGGEPDGRGRLDTGVGGVRDGHAEGRRQLAAEQVAHRVLRGAGEDVAGGADHVFPGELVEPLVGEVPVERVPHGVRPDREGRFRGNVHRVTGDDAVQLTLEPDPQLAAEDVEEGMARRREEGAL